jgi:hypothetical protein
MAFRNSCEVQSYCDPSAARDAQAKKAMVKTALVAQYNSRTCSTIDHSCSGPTDVRHRREYRQTLSRNLREPVQSNERASARVLTRRTFLWRPCSAGKSWPGRQESPRRRLAWWVTVRTDTSTVNKIRGQVRKQPRRGADANANKAPTASDQLKAQPDRVTAERARPWWRRLAG